MNLLGGARVILYDGSPFQPDLKTFVRMIGEQKVTKLGTSPRWMHEMQKNNISPKQVTDLSSLELVTSTGMVLSDQLFEWFYDVGFPAHVQLGNISGGTDLVRCFLKLQCANTNIAPGRLLWRGKLFPPLFETS